jgi:soluble lytic murein transglycosylase-like protein
MIPNPYDRMSRRRTALGTVKEMPDVFFILLLLIAFIVSIAVFVLTAISEFTAAESETVSEKAASEITEAVTVAAPVVVPVTAAWEPSEDVPLDPEPQRYVYEACEAYDVPEALVLALIEHESGFDPDASNGTCYGLMQINKVNYGWLREEGIEPLEYPGNIDAGVLMLGNLLGKYADPHKALMAYNAGEAGAKRLWDRGIYTSSFSRSVTAAAERYERE